MAGKECNGLSKQYSTKQNSDQRVRVKKVENHECWICSKFFASKANLKSHIAVHTGEKNFHCTQCPKKFRYKRGLEEHLVIHNGGNYKCTTCRREFDKPSRLAEHLRLHTGERPFKCKLCPYRSKITVGKKHMINHEKQEEFKCRFCTFSSRINGKVLIHEQKDHGSPIDMTTNSNYAPKNQNSLGTGVHQFHCNVCKFASFSEKYLRIHYSHCHDQQFQNTFEVRSLGQSNASNRSTHIGPAPLDVVECLEESWKDSCAREELQSSVLDLKIIGNS